MNLVLQGVELTTENAQNIANQFDGQLKSNTLYSIIELQQSLTDEQLQILRNSYAFDINVLPKSVDVSAIKLLLKSQLTCCVKSCVEPSV